MHKSYLPVALIAFTIFQWIACSAHACPFCINGRWKPTAPPQHASTRTLYCSGRVRRYYIAAECTVWNYAPTGFDPVADKPIPAPWDTNPSYRKYRYFQYTDGTFTRRVAQPSWLGILGPIIRGVVGDTIQVTFLNRTDRPLSIHPHGVTYDKDDEGAYYYPNPGSGSVVDPGCRHTYVWHAGEGSGPRPGEPSSKVWLYHSHVQGDAEINLGLVGAIIITDPAHARPDGTPNDVDREFVALFSIFHEDAGLNGEMSEGMGDDDDPDALKTIADFKKLSPSDQQTYLQSTQKYSINGYIFGNLPGLDCVQGDHVRWYLLDVGSEQDLHTPHWHGETVRCDNRTTDVVELLPATMKVADMTAENPGAWLFHCHVGEHMMSGMYADYRVHSKKMLPHSEGRPSPTAQTTLVVEPTDEATVLGHVGAYHNFGWVDPLDRSTLTCTFTLCNNGPTLTTIDAIDLPVACTCAVVHAGEPPSPLATPLRIFPGERIDLAFTLDVSRINDGSFFKTIDVHLDSPSTPLLSLELLGIVAPPVVLQPTLIDFGDVRRTGHGKMPAIDVAVDMDARLASGEGKLSFTAVDDNIVLQEIGKPVPADDPQYVRRRYRLSLKPDASIGSLTDKIGIRTSNPIVTARISDEMSERGTFTLVRANVVGDFIVDRVGVAFGAVSQGAPATQGITITAFKPGILPALTITSDNPNISVQTHAGADPHDESVYVTLSPNAPAGNLSAHLTIESPSGARAILPVIAYVR